MTRLHAAYLAVLLIGIPLAIILGLTAIVLSSKGDMPHG